MATRDDLKAQIEAMQKDMEERLANVDTAARDYVTICANKIEATIKKNMRDTVTDPNVTYHRGHHPSKPGYAPAVDTGTLRQSITHSVEADSKGKAVAYVGSLLQNPPYGEYMEYGTSRMKPRPWLKSAIEQCTAFMEEAKDRIIGQAARGRNA